MQPLSPEEFADAQDEAAENAPIQQFEDVTAYNTYVAAESSTDTQRRRRREDDATKALLVFVVAALAAKGAEECLARY